ncbi:AAA family ATPase [Chitinophaga niabensis]|uniref:AAA family ATPase n=1 Tax=Chitinophaga niabensis TaxID=536979 RepID=UPI0031B9C85A
MKTIYLQTLSLRNFKGITDLLIQFGQSTKISGANESGKSTILSAFFWLLTGKDEFDRKDYEIKNTLRKELNAQSHEVEGVFLVNNRELKLKRVYMEDWQKPKGQSQKVFKGHYTEYYVNDVPVSLTEYQADVDAMISPSLIKLLTNPHYFNSLDWKDQRRGLVDIAGEITNEDIFTSMNSKVTDFSHLREVLGSGKYKDLDDYKKQLGAKKAGLKKDSEQYLPRIDEAKRGLPDVLDWDDLAKQIKAKKARVEDIDQQLADYSKGLQEKQKGITALNNEIFLKNTLLDGIRSKIKSGLLENQNGKTSEIASVQNQIDSNNREVSRLEKEITSKDEMVERCKTEIERLDMLIQGNREQWEKINAEKFVFDENGCVCPSCKQQLPVDDVVKTKAGLLKNFNEGVASRKADEVRKSDRSKEQKAQEEKTLQSLEQAIEDLGTQLKVTKEKVPALAQQLADIKELAKNASSIDIEAAVTVLMDKNGDALNLLDEIEELRKLVKIQTDALGEPVTFEKEKAEKATLNEELDELKEKLSRKATIEKTELRIAQLKKEESATAQEIATIEQKEFEIEAYNRAKMDILEKRVNDRFRYVSFRLFDQQVNGGIADTCVCEYKDVPYKTLNTAAKLLAGLDVLNTLSQHYEIYAPVFCDNRESVTFIPEINSQIISLFVSPADTTLRVEAA